MKMFLRVVCFVILLTVLSCTDSDELDPLFSDAIIDNGIVGTWVYGGQSKDFDNTLTIWSDTLKFLADHTGSQSIYKTKELYSRLKFQYYTDVDSVYIYDGGKDILTWHYELKNDTLVLSFPQSQESNYYGLKVYKKKP